MSGVLPKATHAEHVIPLNESSPLTEIESLPPGPYFAQITQSAISLFRACRIYVDPARSFYYRVLQNTDGTFDVLSSMSPLTNGGATVIVPSRLYYPAPTDLKPLSGVRVGLKDLYHLKGLKTGAGDSAYFNLYAAANSTAVSIQH